MTVSDRHRQKAAELLDDVHSGWCGALRDHPSPGPCICRLKGKTEAIAAALAEAEQQAVAPVLALADDSERWARINDGFVRHPDLDDGAHQFHAGIAQAWHAAADRIRQAAGGGR